MKKRILALSLALVMLLCVLPVSADSESNPLDVLVAENGITVDGVINKEDGETGKLTEPDWYKFYNIESAEADAPKGTIAVLWGAKGLYVAVTYKNATAFAMTVNGKTVKVDLTNPAAPAIPADAVALSNDGEDKEYAGTGDAATKSGVLELCIPLSKLDVKLSAFDDLVSLANVNLTSGSATATLAGGYDNLCFTGKVLAKYQSFAGQTGAANAPSSTKVGVVGNVLTFAKKISDGVYSYTETKQEAAFNITADGYTFSAETDVLMTMDINIQEMPKGIYNYLDGDGRPNGRNNLYMFAQRGDSNNSIYWGIYNAGDDVDDGANDFDQLDGDLYIQIRGTNGDVNNTILPLGKKVGEPFRLSLRWTKPGTEAGDSGDLYIYVDGNLIAFVKDAELNSAEYEDRPYAGATTRFNFGYRHQIAGESGDNYDSTGVTTGIPAQIEVSNVVFESATLNKYGAPAHAPIDTKYTSGICELTKDVTDDAHVGEDVCYTCGASLSSGTPSVPEASVPEASVPEASVPEASVPEASVPEASVPEASVPEASVPATSAPATSAPAASAPAASAPATSAPAQNPETGDSGFNAIHAVILTVTLLAVVALMIPVIRNKLIRK